MRAELLYTFTGEEVAQRLGALFISESMCSSGWNTGRFRRIREKNLKDVDEEILKTVYSKARYWQSHGLPREYKCTTDVFEAWIKVFRSCAEYSLKFPVENN